jgi:hypothetical protein
MLCPEQVASEGGYIKAAIKSKSGVTKKVLMDQVSFLGWYFLNKLELKSLLY